MTSFVCIVILLVGIMIFAIGSYFYIGFLVQTTFRILKFDPSTIQHENLQDTFTLLFLQKTD